MFFHFFQKEPVKRNIGFEDMLYILKRREQYILINTLPINQQQCLIKQTLSMESEVSTLNDLLERQLFQTKIAIYGVHHCDPTVEKKQKQLLELGFTNVYVYRGGLFEWLLLQDIYGRSEFPTTSNTLDILLYRPKKMLDTPLLK